MEYVKRDCGIHWGAPRDNGDNRCRKCAYLAELNMRYDLPAESMARFACCLERIDPKKYRKNLYTRSCP
jgi:hypothetical protein